VDAVHQPFVHQSGHQSQQPGVERQVEGGQVAPEVAAAFAAHRLPASETAPEPFGPRSTTRLPGTKAGVGTPGRRRSMSPSIPTTGVGSISVPLLSL